MTERIRPEEHPGAVWILVNEERRRGRLTPDQLDEYEAELWAIAVELAQRFDPDRGVLWPTYLSSYKRHVLVRVLRNSGYIESNVEHRVVPLARALQTRYHAEHGRNPTTAELQEILLEAMITWRAGRSDPSIPIADRRATAMRQLRKSGSLRAIREIDVLLDRHTPASLDAPLVTDDGGSSTFGDTLAAPDTDPGHDLEHDETARALRAWIAAAASGTSARQLDVLYNRLLAATPEKYSTIAARWGVTPERARQVERHDVLPRLLHPTALHHLRSAAAVA